MLGPSIGTWMYVSDDVPDSLDVIFTFSGESMRIDYSEKLKASFPKSQWVISHFYKDKKIKIKDNTNICLVDTCKNTRSEIFFIRDWLKNYKKNEIINVAFISSPFHMKRISLLKRMYLTKWHDKNIRFYYLPVPFYYYSFAKDKTYFNKFWSSSLLKMELLKMIKEIAIKVLC